METHAVQPNQKEKSKKMSANLTIRGFGVGGSSKITTATTPTRKTRGRTSRSRGNEEAGRFLFFIYLFFLARYWPLFPSCRGVDTVGQVGSLFLDGTSSLV